MIKTTLLLTVLLSFSLSAHAERLLVKKHGEWKVTHGKISSFIADPNVEWVEKDILFHVDAAADLPNDPSANTQWTLQKSEVFEALTIASAQTNQNTEPVIVAVIDTGVDLKHVDLKNNIFVNANEIPNNGIDDDQNGFVDDIQGFNFTARPGEDDHNDEDPTSAQDDYNHGTHVAGTIGAIQNNGIGIAGITPRVKILPLRWMIKGSGWGSDAITAIHYAVKMGARVINASWGGIGYSKALEEAVRAAEAKGVLFVASSGNNKGDNDTTPRHPSNLRFSNVISVANINEQDQLSKSSNYGKVQVELAAPGENVYSTVLNNKFGNLSGTSMAAAHVSGVAALVLSVNPKLTAQELKRTLMETVTEVSALKTKTVTGGRVNALAAVKKVLAQIAQSKNKPFYEFGTVELHQLDNSGYITPDQVIDGAAIEGLSVQFTRLVKGVETPVEGITFTTQIHPDNTGGFQKFSTDEEGRIADPVCAKKSFNVTVMMESKFYSVTGGNKPYELDLKLKCGVSQKIIFDETSDAGEVIAIWQVAKLAEKKIKTEIGLDFWKSSIPFIWPAKGDYFDGSSVHLTFGHKWDVVSHEMGHAIYGMAGIGSFGGGEHYIDRCYENKIALSEGWASFYASWLNFDLNATDPGFEYMVPRRAPIQIENIPADVCGLPTNEWRVNGFLWDLIDQHNDTEDFSKPFTTLWKDTFKMRATSLEQLKNQLISKGWDQASLDSIWKLNFPGQK
jgi:hypothetical protein